MVLIASLWCWLFIVCGVVQQPGGVGLLIRVLGGHLLCIRDR